MLVIVVLCIVWALAIALVLALCATAGKDNPSPTMPDTFPIEWTEEYS